MTEHGHFPRPCEDDPSVEDGEWLWRMVHPTQVTKDDASPIGWRPTSGAFIDQQMSVDRAKLCNSVNDTLFLRPANHVAQVTAAELRKLDYCIYADPTRVCLNCKIDIGMGNCPCPECGENDRIHVNLAHAIVCPKMTKKDARNFCERPDIFIHFNMDSVPPTAA